MTLDDILATQYTPEYNARRAGYTYTANDNGGGYWTDSEGNRVRLSGDDSGTGSVASLPNYMLQDLAAAGYFPVGGDLNYIAKNAQYGAGQGFGGDTQALLDYLGGTGSSVVNDPRLADLLNGQTLIQAGDPTKASSPSPIALPNTGNGWFKDFVIPSLITAASVYGAGTGLSSAAGLNAPAGWTSGYDLAGGGALDSPFTYTMSGAPEAGGISTSVTNMPADYGYTIGDVAAPSSFSATMSNVASGATPLADLLKYGPLVSAGAGLLNAGASLSAANTAANASNRATDAQLGMFNTINSQQAPYREAGYTALKDINTLRPFFTHQFDANDLKTNLAPNYQFMLDQGLGAVKNAGNLQTGLISGNTLKGINDYAQNYASNAYQQAFNNYSANQQNIYNRLASIAGLGQTANGQTEQAGSTISGNAAQTMVGAGQAQAAGTIGAANAASSAAQNALGWYALPSLLQGYGNG